MQTSTTRVETFSDGVIAIVITIMILELKIPDFKSAQSEYNISHHLLNVFPHFAAYVFSFVMVGILWVHHHHLFHLLEKTNNFLLGQNLFFLFWISLIPFITGNMGANPVLPVSTALYGFVMLMTSISLAWMRSYTIKKNLVHTDEERIVNKKLFNISVKGKRRSIISSAVYLISIPIAYVSVYLAYLCFLVPVILFLTPSGIDEESIANKVIEKNS
jgi:uncharacterized membrane protein